MKLSIFPQYGALNSPPIFNAFAQGAQKCGHTVVENDLSADCYVIWSVLWNGRMKYNQELWENAKKTGKKILILEVGGLVRGKTWRVGLNHVNGNGIFYKEENFDFNRPEKLGIFLRNRKNTGQTVLICGQHHKSEQWSTRPKPEVWLKNLVEAVRQNSTRPIVFRPHPRDHEWVKFLPKLDIEIKFPRKISESYDDFDHDEDFKNAWCVINPCSNTGIQAAIAGIPVFTDFDSLAYEISNKNLEKIETPELPNRDSWLIKICHTEWLKEELENGIPQSRLL